MVISAGASKAIGILGQTFAVADKTLSATFTNTGLAGSFAKTGGSDPAIVLHGEAGGAGTVTVILLN